MTRPIRRSPAANTLVVLGVVVLLIVLGAVLWIRWDAAAMTADPAYGSDSAALWMLVVVGGPILLLAALIWSKFRTRAATRRADPETPSDDPSKGMSGHG